MKTLRWIFLSGIISFIFLVSCQKNDQQTIKLGEVTRSLFYAPQYIAIEEGFFAEEGLDVELQTTWGGDTTMTALLSDSIDVALVGSETSIYVYAQDSRDYAINFAQLTQTDGTFLVAKEAHPEFAWEDVKGKTFLGQRKGGMPQMVGEFVLKKYGMNPHADLDLSQNIDFANIPGAFASGDYEFVQLFEPTASIFEQEGSGHVVASFGEESGTVPYTVFMAKKSRLEDDKETITKFTKAIYHAQQFVYEESAETIAKSLSPYFEDTDLDMLVASIERYKSQDSYAKDPILKVEDWNNLKNIMDEAGELPEDVPYEELVNTEIAEEVMNQ